MQTHADTREEGEGRGRGGERENETNTWQQLSFASKGSRTGAHYKKRTESNKKQHEKAQKQQRYCDQRPPPETIHPQIPAAPTQQDSVFL